jgi:methylmalonyl-CoA mutase C-terminal domain/subunit
MGMDQHENGAVAVARILREAQMQARYLGRFQTPESVAEGALREGAEVIGISCHSWEYLRLVPRLVEELARRGADVPVVIGGSVITAADAERMKAAGVAAVFAAGARDTEIINCIRDLAARKATTLIKGTNT